MIELYRVANTNLYDKVKELSSRHIPLPTEILKTENGKPYFKGNPLYFSVAHSGDRAVIALCDKPVGVDLELDLPRRYEHTLARFHQAEREEIADRADFLIHWTVREAFIKMKGSTLSRLFGKMKYSGGAISIADEVQNCKIITHKLYDGYAAVCVQL